MDAVTIDPEATYIVDGQEITGQDLLNQRMMQSDYTSKTQELAPLRHLAEQYGLAPDELAVVLTQSVEAIRRAEEAGVQFTPDGRVVLPTPESASAGPSQQEPPAGPVQESTPIEALLDQQAAHLGTMQAALGVLLRDRIESEVRAAYPQLSDEDIGVIMNLSSANPTKSPLEHAAWLAEKIPAPSDEPAGGSTPPLPGGQETGVPAGISDKRIVFKPSSEGDVSVDTAIQAFLDAEGVK